MRHRRPRIEAGSARHVLPTDRSDHFFEATDRPSCARSLHYGRVTAAHLLAGLRRRALAPNAWALYCDPLAGERMWRGPRVSVGRLDQAHASPNRSIESLIRSPCIQPDRHLERSEIENDPYDNTTFDPGFCTTTIQPISGLANDRAAMAYESSPSGEALLTGPYILVGQ